MRDSRTPAAASMASSCISIKYKKVGVVHPFTPPWGQTTLHSISCSFQRWWRGARRRAAQSNEVDTNSIWQRSRKVLLASFFSSTTFQTSARTIPYKGSKKRHNPMKCDLDRAKEICMHMMKGLNVFTLLYSSTMQKSLCYFHVSFRVCLLTDRYILILTIRIHSESLYPCVCVHGIGGGEMSHMASGSLCMMCVYCIVGHYSTTSLANKSR